LDQIGPRKVVPLGAASVAIGAILFSTGDPTWGSVGRFMQGAGGVFALIGAVYLVSTFMPASRAATLIGVTQMFGMAGGSAGQFVVGPLIGSGLALGQLLVRNEASSESRSPSCFSSSSRGKEPKTKDSGNVGLGPALRAMGTVFANPQSILCGLIAGFIFIPTTIFDMVWGVRFLRKPTGFPTRSRSCGSAAVPFGWIIGCPLLGC
jgi:hypothetical protein